MQKLHLAFSKNALFHAKSTTHRENYSKMLIYQLFWRFRHQKVLRNFARFFLEGSKILLNFVEKYNVLKLIIYILKLIIYLCELFYFLFSFHSKIK